MILNKEILQILKEKPMKKKITILMIALLLITLFVTVGCKKQEAAVPAAAQPVAVVEKAAPAAPVAPVIDKDALLLAKAKEYFAATATNSNAIKPADVYNMLNDNPDSLVIIDIRSAADFEKGHILGAYHSDWAKLGDVLENIPTNRQVVVTCYSGQTAGQAVGALRLAGFTNVKSLQSGMTNGWLAADLPAEETGARELSSRAKSTSPKTEEDKILWEVAKANFDSVAKDGNKLIDPQALYDALQTNPKAFTVVDIRRAEDFAKGHIEFAQNTAWAEVGNLIPSLPKNGKIAVTCYTGQTAGQTVGVLRSMGYDAYSLKGGMNNGWLKTDLPTIQ